MASRLDGTLEITGTTTFTGTVVVPAGTFGNADISSSSTRRIAADKLIHRVDLNYSQANGTDVVSATQVLRVCRAAGTILGVSVRPTTAPTGGDKAYTVDVLTAADASGSWTSVLTAPITMNSSDADNALNTGTLSGTPVTVADGAIRVVVATSGSTGSQGQGVVVSVYYSESPS